MGRLTRDPQLSYMPSQTAVVEFGLAVNRRWTGQDGAQRDETCFVDCRAFSKQAETINKYCKKGNPLFVEGRLTFETWAAQDGSRRSRHRVIVLNFQFLGAGAGAAEKAAVSPERAEAGGESAGSLSGAAGEVGAEARQEDEIPF